MKTTIQDLLYLQSVYGETTTLAQIIADVKGDNIHPCPACGASGKVVKEVRKPYPSGFPDSGWVPDTIVEKEVNCELCKGFGFNNKEYKPRMVQNGWE